MTTVYTSGVEPIQASLIETIGGNTYLYDRSFDFPLWLKEQDSINSAFDTNVRRVKWVPKNPKILHLRKPREPKFNPPKHKVLKARPIPIIAESIDGLITDQLVLRRRNRRNALKYNVYKSRWLRKEKQIQLRVERYNRAFKLRLEKYLRYKKLYESIQDKIRKGVISYKLVNLAKRHFTQDHPYSRTLTKFDLWGCRMNTTWVEYGYHYVYDNVARIPETLLSHVEEEIAPEIASHVAALQSKVRRKMDDKLVNNAVHFGSLAVERVQTMRLILDNFQGVVKLLTGQWTSILFDFKSVRKAVSGRFLEFTYGVQPLVRDMDGLLKEIVRLEQDPTQTDVVIVRSNSTDLIDLRADGILKDVKGDVFLVPVPCTLSYQVFGKVTVSRVHKWKLKDPTAAATNRLGLLNPWESIWEWTPWSFVVDWVLPIQSWLRSFSASAGYEWISGTETVTTDLHIKANFTSTDAALSVYPSFDSYLMRSGLSAHKEVKNRVVIADAPGIFFPRIKNPYSMFHGMETVALLDQLIGRKR